MKDRVVIDLVSWLGLGSRFERVSVVTGTEFVVTPKGDLMSGEGFKSNVR